MNLTAAGTPGYKTPRTATPNDVLASAQGARYATGYRVLDGSLTRDPLQSPTYVFGGGRPVGRVTTGGKFRPWYIGLTNADATNGATSITVTAAVATEVARLRAVAGGNVSLVFIGPPSAAGTVATLAAVNCTAASGTTLTVAAIGAALAAGSLICVNDGSQTVRGIHNAPWGTLVVDEELVSIDQPLVNLLLGGHVESTRIPDYNSMDASVKTFVKTQLRTVGPFTFTDDQ